MVPRKILLPLFTAACFSGGAMAQENARFVHGSYVNVRENAAPDSAVVDHVTTNTPVEVLAQADKRCQIRYGADKTGFVPCNLLGNRKLTLAEVGQKWIADPDPAKGNVDNPAYSPPRAFWISPSADGLLSAGEHFERTLLSKAQYELEHGVDPQGRWLMFDALDQDGPRDSEYEALHYIPKLLRYPVPEFEAMKAVLENGIVVAPDNPERWMSCAELEQAREAHYQKWPPIKPETIGWYRLLNPHDLAYAHIEFCKTHDCRNPDLRPLIEQCTVFGLELPKIKPSFFKSTPAILPGDPGVEAISSAFGLKEYGKTVSGPRWGLPDHYEPPKYMGAWDIGRYALEIREPIFEHVIGADGKIGVYAWQPKEVLAVEDNDCMPDAIQERHGTRLVDGYAKVPHASLWFEAKAPLPLHEALVSNKVHKVDAGEFYGEKTPLAVQTIDLDRDGVPDFVQWSVPEGEAMYSWVIFINLDGVWHIFDKDEPARCGC